MTETPTSLEIGNNNSLKINPVKLDEESVKGLSNIQIDLMKTTAQEVNNYVAVAGQATREAMKRLYYLQQNVGRGNWTAFLNSGVLSTSAKVTADLYNAYSKWLRFDNDISDEIIGCLSSRTLVAIANQEPEVRTQVKAKIMSGATSENEVRKVISAATGKSGRAKDKTTEKRVDDVKKKVMELFVTGKEATNLKDMIDSMRMLKDMNMEITTNNNQFRTENETLLKRLDSLKEKNENEVSKLKKKIDELEKELEFAKA